MNAYELDDVEVQQTSGMMAQLNKQIDVLMELKAKMDAAEQAYKEAEEKYILFSRETLPSLFFSNGIESLIATNGQMVSIVTKTSCSINKNANDKNNVADWLRNHDGEELVKTELHVPEYLP